MPQFRYHGDDQREFPHVQADRLDPGQTVQADENPDPVFFTEVMPKPSKAADKGVEP